MKKHILVSLTVTILTMISACGQEEQKPGNAAETDSVPSLAVQIQRCSRLYTTEYHIHKIITHDDVVRLKGNLLSKDFDITMPLGERRIAIPMDATLKAYIDFSDFSEENIERYGDQIVIVLPDPQLMLTSTKIDQNATKEYVGLVRSHFTDKERVAYEQQGRQAILNSVEHMDFLPTAQANAARVLVPLVKELGYEEENITIAFRKDLNLKKIIKSSIEP